ncbi:MAG TPA: hypothetical protein VK742_04185 [Candidatus Sulfotelmatobacter sp.]|jgi:hypothetical protein|nr:hypothetical protein [Candidatus Sulfotelmatobacter sp.]
MMKKSVLFFLTAIAINICKAQSDASQTNSIWNESVQGVHLSIAISNSVIALGSTVIVFAKIQNASTNTIKMAEEGVLRDFDVILKDGFGKETKLSPDTSRWPRTFSKSVTIKPGETREWKIPVTINKEVFAGDYKLIVSTKQLGYDLISNYIDVAVE